MAYVGPSEPGVLTLTEYSRSRGISYASLRRAVDDGRLSLQAIRTSNSGRLVGIVADLADAELAGNTDPGRREVGLRERVELEETPADQPKTYAEHRAARERYNAELTRLELLEKLGMVTATEDVMAAADRTARAVKESLLVIPDRVCSLVAAETDPGRVHAILMNEIRQALHALSRPATESS